MRSLKAFLLGMLAVGVVAYAVAAALAVSAQAAGRALDVGLGPLEIVSVVMQGSATTTTTFGPGLAALAVGGGLLNLTAAWVVRRGAEREVDHVD